VVHQVVDLVEEVQEVDLVVAVVLGDHLITDNLF
jgi:hypothetical protein